MLKNTSVILLGTVLAQLIGIVTLPLIAKLYSPQAYGQFQVVVSLTAILLPILTFRYELALLRIRSAFGVQDLMVIVGASLVLVSVVTWLGAKVVCWYFLADVQEPLWASWVLPVTLLGVGLFHFAGHLAIRTNDAFTIASSKVTQTGITQGLSLLLGALASVSPISLVLSDFTGRVCATLLILRKWFQSRGQLAVRRSHAQLIRTARVFRRYPIYNVPSGLVGAMAMALPMFVLTAYHSEAIAGQFAIALRFLFFPVAMASAAAGQAVSGQLSTMIRTGSVHESRSFLSRIVVLSLVAGTIICLIIFLLAPPLLNWLLGKQWALVGGLVAPMLPLIMATILSGPINMTLVISGQSRLQLFWDLARVFLIMIALVSGVTFFTEAKDVVLLHSLAMLSGSILFVVLALGKIDGKSVK